MTRRIAESTNKLSVFFLKKHGYLPQGRSHARGRIIWTRDYEEESMGFWVKTETEEDGGYVELIYTNTNRQSGEKTDMKYKVPLTTTPCNYGGKRYWFLCSLSRNGVHCGRRVGVIYSVGKWFGCRYCANVAYQSQLKSGIERQINLISESDVMKAYEEVKREYYNGKPTRKYKHYLRLEKKMSKSWAGALANLGTKH